MKTRTRQRLGAALVIVMVGMLAVMMVLFARLPEDSTRDRLAPPPVTERVAAVEGVFCDLLADGMTDQRFGTALSQSGELQHRTLGQLAAEWGRTGDPGARAQVLMECRRLGLAP
jgi:hypothetical protein